MSFGAGYPTRKKQCLLLLNSCNCLKKWEPG
jgi:hypothetical protein